MRVSSLVVALPLFAASFCCFAAECRGAEPSVAPGQLDNFSLSGVSEKGRKNWDLRGTSADIGAEVIRLKDVESHLYGDNSTVRITADHGDFNRQQGTLHLEKDVVITTTSGAKLTTDSLDWNRREQTLSTDDPVNIEKQDVRITGRGVRGRSDLNQVDLQQDVRVDIKPQADARGQVSAQRPPPGDAAARVSTQRPGQEDGQPRASAQPVVITCKGPMQVDYQANIAVFNRDVEATTADGVIQSDVMVLQFARPDKGTAGFRDLTDTGGTRIDRIAAKGNVVIRRGDNVSYCDEAVYTAADRKISLTGSPRLVIYSENIDASAGN